MERNILFLCIFLLYFVHMGHSQTQASDEPKEVSISDFPMTVGSQWTYLRTDSLFQSIHYQDTRTVEQETVTIQITSEHKKGNKEKILEWVRTFPTVVDTEYVVIKEDTVTLFTSVDTAKSEVVFHFVFPLKTNKRWAGESRNSDSISYRVVRQESVTVPAGKFTNAYWISRRTWDPEDSTFVHHFPESVNYWVVSEIGIVKMNKYTSSAIALEHKSTTWELIKYDIKK